MVSAMIVFLRIGHTYNVGNMADGAQFNRAFGMTFGLFCVDASTTIVAYNII